MGAFNAIIFSSIFPIKKLIAFSPQFSIHPEISKDESFLNFAAQISHWKYKKLKFSNKTKYLLNSVGSIFLGWTTSIVIIFVGFNGKQSIINSPITNFEVTQQGSVGMFIKYHMAVFLGIFGITMLIQFISYFFESIADYKNEKGKRVVTNSSGY